MILDINALLQILSLLAVIVGVVTYWARLGIISPFSKAIDGLKETINNFACTITKLDEAIVELKKMQDELKEKVIITDTVVKDFSARLAKLEEKVYDK